MKDWFQRTGGQVLGWILVVGGLALIPLPGPGTLALVAGVALLAPHYAWARRILDPLHDRAVEGAKTSVSTKPRIVASMAGVVWILGLGAVWILGPTFPPFAILGWAVGPKPPGGMSVGMGLVTSGVAAGLLLAYSVTRWYPGSGKA
ncbi:MAG TPA: PGPGW domain-containing protein [Aeromicrobium sp.]|nr:PGPGW domain-containing protein [Aeromicrobium sp.]